MGNWVNCSYSKPSQCESIPTVHIRYSYPFYFLSTWNATRTSQEILERLWLDLHRRGRWVGQVWIALPYTWKSLVYNLYLVLLVVIYLITVLVPKEWSLWREEADFHNGRGGGRGSNSHRGHKLKLESSSRAAYVSIHLLKGTLQLTIRFKYSKHHFPETRLLLECLVKNSLVVTLIHFC